MLNVKIFRTLFVILFVVINVITLKSQTKFNNSILWEIRKSDSAKPSYLLGTIHMIDTSEYILPMDTFKLLISRCGNLCLEANLDFQNQKLPDVSSMGDGKLNAERCLNRKRFKKLVGILESLGTTKDEISFLTSEVSLGYLNTTLTLTKLLTDSSYKSFFMDYDLYYFAKNSNRIKIYALETPENQVQTIRNIFNSNDKILINLNKTIDSFYKKNSTNSNLDYFNQNFIASDTNLISKSDSILYLNLINRNKTMVKGIDSLISNNNVIFIAVGVGHLFGTKGILQLLYEKGYLIKPNRILIRKKTP